MEELVLDQGIIYYTSNSLGEPIFSTVQSFIKKSGLPIVSSSIEPIDFGDNAVIKEKPSYITMVRQIISCLDRSKSKYIFFCEHDVLYPKSHFDFIPPRDDTFYYNRHVWRWLYGSPTAISYNELISLSALCVNRETALQHYFDRLNLIAKNGWKMDSHEPWWVRRMGYEPGKSRSRGGYFDVKWDSFYSKEPMLDIRHPGTLTRPKTTLREFKHPPYDWHEVDVNLIPEWNVKELFNL